MGFSTRFRAAFSEAGMKLRSQVSTIRPKSIATRLRCRLEGAYLDRLYKEYFVSESRDWPRTRIFACDSAELQEPIRLGGNMRKGRMPRWFTVVLAAVGLLVL
jgi:hypothetical protein